MPKFFFDSASSFDYKCSLNRFSRTKHYDMVGPEKAPGPFRENTSCGGNPACATTYPIYWRQRYL
jgi:hypothetical protein